MYFAPVGLHKPGTLFARNHLGHHASVGSLTEAEDLNLGGSPVWIALLFLANGLPVITVDLLFRLRTAPGTLLGFVVYVLVVEEMHWRIHLGEKLPPGLNFARSHHFMHHDRPNSRYNIFFPVFDLLLGSLGPGTVKPPSLYGQEKYIPTKYSRRATTIFHDPASTSPGVRQAVLSRVFSAFARAYFRGLR
jgi:sterol desaturase/sphingolipid hydroxylase (fatty acid hydroxylase superfamily)